jgi:hypothetical protein
MKSSSVIHKILDYSTDKSKDIVEFMQMSCRDDTVINEELSKSKYEKPDSKKKPKMMSMLDKDPEQEKFLKSILNNLFNFLKLGHNEIHTNPNILILCSENEEVANKWVCVIDYFITK